jgi:putative ABC transport system substrate-binding protein
MEPAQARLWSRRHFVQGAGALSLALLAACGQWPSRAQEQRTARLPRIGWLSPGHSPSSGITVMATNPLDILRQGLGELGYVEGQNVLIVARSGEESSDLLAARAVELAQLPVDVIVAFGAPAPFAARQATQTVPIVMLGGSPDPVGYGLIASYARPGGNVTGLTALPAGALGGKYLELLKDVVPGLSKVARLFDASAGTFAGSSAERTNASAAQSLGLQVHVLEVRDPPELEGALAAAHRAGAEALTVVGTPLLMGHARRIAEVALQHGWPTIGPWRPFTQAGFLMSYGAGALPTVARRAADYVDKILKGAKPADLPVEQPMRFDFVINLRTAEALGLTIPRHILLQATEVIQ